MFISKSIKTEIVTITPQIAEQLLSRNSNNRNVSPTSYNKVLEAMSEDEWELNGEAVKIASDDRKLDRFLVAVNEAGARSIADELNVCRERVVDFKWEDAK